MLHAWAPVVSSVMITIGSMLTPSAPGEVSVDNVDTTSFMLTPWALCWHCELPVRTDENWQRKHRPGPGTGHWPSQGHSAVCGVVLSGLSFYVTTARRCVQDSGSTTSAAKYAQLATPWVRNQITKNPSATSFYPPPPDTTQQPFTRAHWRLSSQPIIKYFYLHI